MSNVDRSVRNLSALRGASTSRVLNLVSIASKQGADAEYKAQPLFISPVLNRAILLRHQVRGDETYLFASRRSVATKIIMPFDDRDLKLGGRSFFVDQRGYLEALQQFGNYREGYGMERDIEVLRLIDTVPSLDPFLLREHLRINAIDVAPCYFEISPADRSRMYDYVSKNLQQLIKMATGGGPAHHSSTSKLVSALLSSEVDEKLEPLRLTLGLAGDDFREGVFSWRGFLYYKWSMMDFWPRVNEVMRDVRNTKPSNAQSAEIGRYILEAKRRVVEAVKTAGHEVGVTLKTYDVAYSQLIADGNPQAFREFLLSAPGMFLDLGEKVGAISHICSFWNYRFPKGHGGRVDAEELAAILQDFESGFGIGQSQNFAAAS
ncbi:MAG TPA: hypothetical protein VIJ85_06665 [Rhizomicrobium sp.]